MRIRITTWTGAQSEGILLSTCGSIVRVAIPGCDDSVEFSYRGAHWFSESGEPMEIEYPAQDDGHDLATALNPKPSDPCLGSDSCRTRPPAWVN